MKRILYIFSFMLLSVNMLDAQGLDSLTKADLSGRIEAYFGALAGESMDVQKEEADFMIGLSSDSLTRQFMAVKIYEYFSGSKLMGAEGVAVHVFDKWFKDKTIRMDSDEEYFAADLFAEFNRRSLIGEKAPELVVEAIDGILDTLGTDGRYSVLFFYDTDCSKCRLETALLDKLLATEKFPVRFTSFYVGDNFTEWKKYEEQHFLFDNDIINSYSYWDPEIRSDYQRKYGVIQTPRMFLMNPEGIIIGRGLDTRALSLMLHEIFDEVRLEYGGEESMALFDRIFEGVVTKDEVKGIADYIESSTLDKGNQVMFRQMTGDLLYWLSARTGEVFREGTDYLVDSKILTRPEVWTSSDDSLKVIGLAEFMDSLLERAEPGTEIASVKVPAERIRSGKSRSRDFRLDRLRGKRNIVIFYTEGCANCRAEKAAARELASADRNVCVFFVNVDEIVSSSPSLGNQLFEAFDLSTLPFIIETDRKGTIIRRYMTLLQ